MSITSLHFGLLFCVVFIFYYWVTPRIRWWVLLAAGVYFYFSWSLWNLLLFAILIFNNFYIARYISDPSSSQRNRIFAVGLGMNLGALIAFKYLDFIVESVATALSGFRISAAIPYLNVLAPVGISFYVFQSVAYLVDVQRRTQEPERHFGKLALFFSFFPIISSGPIERAKTLLPQINTSRDFDLAGVRLGFKRIAWGAFKKLVIADRLAIYVNQVFDHPSEFSGFPIVLAVLFFAFQLYCDFSGYSDMVIGMAKTLGYNLTENFQTPYFSKSIQNFWNTWHISLSSWLRDYVFFPIRRNMLRSKELPSWLAQFAPPLITMLVCGAWHGASWTFILWGGLHGLYLVLESYIKPVVDRRINAIGSEFTSKLYSVLQTCLTFSLVCFGWIFFRANSIADAIILIKNIGVLKLDYYASAVSARSWDQFFKPFVFDGGLSQFGFLFSLFLILFLLSLESIHARIDLFSKMDSLPLVLRWAVYFLALFVIILLSADAGTQNFIYFQF